MRWQDGILVVRCQICSWLLMLGLIESRQLDAYEFDTARTPGY